MRNVIYIDRNYLYYYGGNVHAPIPLQFQPTVVKDMELINYESLEKQIDSLITTNKMQPDDTGIVIAHQSSFEKLIPPKIVGVALENEKKSFLDNVPFEDIMYQVFPTSKGTKLVAVNKELLYAIKDIFQLHGFRIVTITSIATLYPDTDVPFNVSLAQQILKKPSLLDAGSFPIEDVEIPNTDTYDESNKPLKNNNRLYLLIGVFIILIGSLTAVLLLRKPAEKKTQTIVPTAAPVIQVSPSPQVASAAASITTSPSISPPRKSGITIQILNGSGIAGQADELKTQIEDAGYASISTGNAPTLQSSRSLVVFKPGVPQEVRQEITNLVSELIGEVTVQENSEISGDVVITTTRTNSTQPTPTP